MIQMWRKHLLAILVVSLAAHLADIALAKKADTLSVTTQQGVVKGKVLMSANGRTIYAFHGIPYAKPPTGNLRFRAPERPSPWEGERDATKLGPKCIQVASNGKVVGSEDCLYLNVFTTQLPKQHGRPTRQTGRLLDVMFWIHGGGFYFGSANDYPPQYIMEKDVVYVSTNYRLGVLGFLSTEDDESPGNYGMKDQTAALEWVQENIAAFGGNPNSVTIFGQSAGSISAHYHTLSNLSTGLYHRAISMSGTALFSAIRCENPLRMAQLQAQIVNCPVNNTSALVDCLRHSDAVTLTRTYPSEQNLLQDMLYVPCPEKQTSRNPKPFLKADPFSLITAGDFNKVPWIVGSTSQETASVTAYLVNNKTVNKRMNQNFEYFCTKFLFLSPRLTKEESHSVYQKFVDFYLNGNEGLSQQNAYQFTEGMTDRNVIYSVKQAVEQQYAKGQNEIFWYHFAYRGLYSGTSDFSLRNYGVAHADDLLYLFPIHLQWPYPPSDREVVELMLDLWTNFAKFGNPTPATKPSERHNCHDVEWLPVYDVGSDSSHMRYYNIGQVVLGTPNDFLNENLGPVKLKMAVDLHEKGMAFWESLNLKDN